MPFIEVILEDGKFSQATKQALVEGVAGVVRRVLQSKPEQIRIVLYEIPEGNLFDGSKTAPGELTVEP